MRYGVVVKETLMLLLLGTAFCVACTGKDEAKAQIRPKRAPRIPNVHGLATLEWALWMTGLYLKSRYEFMAFPPLKLFYYIVYVRLSYLSLQVYRYFLYNFVTIRIIGDQVPTS